MRLLRFPYWIFGVLAALAFADTAAPAAADEPRLVKRFLAVRAAAPPKIDGILDDPVWRVAPPDDRFVQEIPTEGQPPRERTEMRIAYDDDALYVAFVCHQSPAGVVARLTRRDRDVEADYVEVLIDSRNDGSTAYGFRVNAAAVQTDTLYYGDLNATLEWDAVWTSAVSTGPYGWTVEIAIPLSVLRFSSADVQSWGLEVQRYLSYAKETDYWAAIPRSAPGFVSLFGRLDGLRGLTPRRTWELRPYFALRLALDSPRGGAFLAFSSTASRGDVSKEVGLDFKLGVTSDLTLDATVNPDFGQVEADQVVLNLSRFETFYPEKRPFFLESLDLFQTTLPTFYSRRIGKLSTGLAAGDQIVSDGGVTSITEAPREVSIMGAAKLTGKIARPLELGLLAAVTDREEITTSDPKHGERTVELAPRRLFSVARLRYALSDASNFGLQATGLVRLDGSLWQASADHDAFTQSADANWIIDPRRWRVLLQAVLSEKPGGPSSFQTADGSACPSAKGGPGCAPLTRTDGTRLEPGDVGWGLYGFILNTGEHHVARLIYHSYSPKLDVNDMGFLPQFNEHFLRAVAGYREPRPGGHLLSYDILPGAEITWSFDGVRKEANLFWYADAITTSQTLVQFELDAWPTAWDLNETFDGSRWEKPSIYGGDLIVTTDSRKKVVLMAESKASFGDDGSYDIDANGKMSLQVLPQLELSLAPEVGVTSAVRFYSCTAASGVRCTVDDAARSYRFARLDSSFLSLTLRGSWTFSTRLTFQAYAQLFMDTGAWSAYRGISVVAPKATIRRRDLVPIAFRGDLNGDGIKDDDFENTNLNINLVIRWEFVPGSEVIGVFTRTELGAPLLSGRPPRLLNFGGLSQGPTEDILLLKLVYFLG